MDELIIIIMDELKQMYNNYSPSSGHYFLKAAAKNSIKL